MIGSRNHLEFLNTRNASYREWGWKDNPPTRAEAIAQMVQQPNLIKRPILVEEGKITLGFVPEAYGGPG